MEHVNLDGNHITNAVLERIHALLEEVKKPGMLADMENNDDDDEFDDGFDLAEFAFSLVCFEIQLVLQSDRANEKLGGKTTLLSSSLICQVFCIFYVPVTNQANSTLTIVSWRYIEKAVRISRPERVQIFRGSANRLFQFRHQEFGCEGENASDK